MPADDLSRALARRLRQLRESHWPDLRITQDQLRQALGVSVPLISSWESVRGPLKVPPPHRIEAYAAFFATRRSAANGVPRVPPISELTTEEREEHRKLLGELTRLRHDALRALNATHPARDSAPAPVFPSRNPWHFADGGPVTIICSQVPEADRAKIPYASYDSPDYIESYKYSDLDSLFELHGHLRAMNPSSLVTLRAAQDLRSDDLTTHVVLLGGPDFNQVTASMLERIDLPVRLVADWESEKGPYFELDESNRYYTHVQRLGDTLHLHEDVGFFYRGPNPNNVERTLSMCNAMYARGVYGVVRALTDPRFSERNAGYLTSRFGAAPAYSILSRVRMEGHIAITPDWTLESYRLHEWSRPTAGH